MIAAVLACVFEFSINYDVVHGTLPALTDCISAVPQIVPIDHSILAWVGSRLLGVSPMLSLVGD